MHEPGPRASSGTSARRANVPDSYPADVMNLIGWIFVGFLAGSISAGSSARRPPAAACRTSSSVSSAACVGGWLAIPAGVRPTSRASSLRVVVAALGPVLVALVLDAMSGR